MSKRKTVTLVAVSTMVINNKTFQPGETFKVGCDDPRLSGWLRAGNVTVHMSTKGTK